MNYKVAERQTEGYQVSTNIYEGPLDLLLELIEKAELDITTLALAQVTDQYLDHLRIIQIRDPSEVSAFLVIAARLIQIKSAALLPKPVLPDQSTDEEDPGEALARQLILYRRYKQLSLTLKNREENGLQTFLRIAPPVIKVDPKLDLEGITTQDLIAAARLALKGKMHLPALDKVVNVPKISIRERINFLITNLKQTGKNYFHKMLNSGNRAETVVTFLALLELIKRHIVQAKQENLFGKIEFFTTGTLLDDSSNLDIEFDE